MFNTSRRKRLFSELLEERRVLAALSIADISVSESVGTFAATIVLSEPDDVPVTFTVATSGGSATGGLDYRIAFNDGSIAPGSTSTTVNFVILQDAIEEPVESFFLNISSPRNATIADGQARVSIVDDDGDPVPDIEFRSIDGSANNIGEPLRGAANQQVIRFGYPAGYADIDPAVAGDEGVGDIITAPDVPNPRTISNLLMAQTESIPNDRNLSDWVVQWGQFLTHELAHVDSNTANNVLSDGSVGEFSIPIPDASDPLGPNPIQFNRSAFDPTTGNGQSHVVNGSSINPRQQMNGVTSYIDASVVYGSDPDRANALRTFEDGKLKTTASGELPGLNVGGFAVQNVTPIPDRQLFLAGDVRANENFGLLSTQTLFVREHNRLATLIKQNNPSLNDEQIYQWSRRIVGAEIQKITYEEFLPAVMGEAPGDDPTPAPDPNDYEYDPQVKAVVTNSFTTAFFRFGHSMQSSEMLLVNNDDTVQDSLSLRDSFFNIELAMMDPTNVDRALKGLGSQVAQENDIHFVDSLRNFLFGSPGAGGTDLASLDIQRGRDHGLIPFNQLRLFYGLSALDQPSQGEHPFSTLTSDVDLQLKLETIYGDVGSVEAIVGAIAEDHVPGASVGSMVRASLFEQFKRLRDGDRFFYTGDEALQNPIVTNVIDFDSLSLAQLIKNNTTISNIQDNVFFVPNSDSGPPTPDPPSPSGTTASAWARDVTEVPENNFSVVIVTYKDDVAVDASDIGQGDVEIVAPDGKIYEPRFTSKSSSVDEPFITAGYALDPPGGTWDSTDNGTYQVRLRPGQVSNSIGSFYSPTVIGSYEVNMPAVPDNERPIASAAFSVIDQASPFSLLVPVVYLDNIGIDETTITSSNVHLASSDGRILRPVDFRFDRTAGVPSPGNNIPTTVIYEFEPPGGIWDAADNGHFLIWVRRNQVRDVNNNSVDVDRIGSVTFRIEEDNVAPTAVANAEDLTFPGPYPQNIVVDFSDDLLVDVSGIGAGDVTVIAPNGTTMSPTFLFHSPNQNAESVSATFRLNAPGGSWDPSDNGTYRIRIGGNRVMDAAGNSVPSGQIGSFLVSLPVPDQVRPTAVATANELTLPGPYPQDIVVQYSDNIAVDASDIGSGDITVTVPGGVDFQTSFVSRSTNQDGKSISATYRLNAPGGSWDASDNGIYEIRMGSSRVADTSDNSVEPGVIGTFHVNLPVPEDTVFKPQQTLVASNTGHRIVPFDLDVDGDVDIVSADGDVVRWFENDGTQQYASRIVASDVEAVREIFAIDMDADGDIDVLSARQSGEVLWHENLGSQNFTTHLLSSGASRPTAIQAADLDQDGDIDIAVASEERRKFFWLENEGDDLSFVEHDIHQLTYPQTPDVLDIVDIDLDGDLDLVASSQLRGDLGWWENNGHGIFTQRSMLPVSVANMKVVDFDFDGDNDFVVNWGGGSDILEWYANDGSNHFSNAAIRPVLQNVTNMEVTDFDNDGDMDIIASGTGSAAQQHITWLENNGDNSFIAHRLANDSSSLTLIDLDSDGDKDVLALSNHGSEITWFENRTETSEDPVTPTPERVPGDASGDGLVDFADFLILARGFGRSDALFSDGDFDDDGVVGFTDFLILSRNFGKHATND